MSHTNFKIQGSASLLNHWTRLTRAEVPIFKSCSIEALNALPSRFRASIIKHFDNRRAKNCGLPLLGELAPAMICDLCGIPVTDLFEKSSLEGWFQIYYSIILSDDFLDDENAPDKLRIYLSAMLLQQKGVARIQPVLKNLDFIDSVFATMAEAADDESKKGAGADLSSAYVSRRIAKEKLAVLDLLLHIIKPNSLSATRFKGIRRCLAAFSTLVQFLDDITDFRDDLAGNHNTNLTVYTLQFDKIDEECLIKAYENGVRMALAEAQECLRLFSLYSIVGTETENIIKTIQNTLSQALKDLACAMVARSAKEKQKFRTDFYRKLNSIAASS